MASLRTYHREQYLAVFLKSMLIAVYTGLGVASLWIVKDLSPGFIAGRIFPYGVPALLSLTCAAFLSLFVLTLERIRTETLLFALICLAFAGLNLDILLIGIVEDSATALAISRFDHFFLALVLLGADLHLVFLVCEKKHHWWLVWLAYATGFVIALFTPTDYYLIGMYEYYWGFFARQGVLYSFISLLWLLALFYSIWLLTVTSRQLDDPSQKDKIRFLIYGFLCTATLSLTNTPAMYGYEVYPLGTFGFISLLLLAYGLFKYNMRLAMQQLRTVFFYTGHFMAVVAAGLTTAALLPDSKPFLKLVSGITTAALLFIPLRLGWSLLLDLIFKRSPNYLKKAFNDLTYQLSGGHHLKTLCRITAQWLFAEFLNSRCALVFHNEERREFTGWSIRNPDFSKGFFSRPTHTTPEDQKDQPLCIRPDHPVIQRLKKERMPMVTAGTLDRWVSDTPLRPDTSDWLAQAGILIPVFYRDELQGLLVIGSRSSNRSYSRAEKAILANLAVVLGPFIENARLLENLEEQVSNRTHALHTALEESEEKNLQIETRNELILRQNHIILTLFDTTTRIHEIDAFDKLFSFVLNQLRDLFPELGFAILLEGGRSGILESGAFSGLAEREQKRILENRSGLDERNIDDLLRQDFLRISGAEEGSAPPLWTLLPMMIRDRRLGKMIIRGKALDPNTRQVISIFLAQVAAVAQNKLLLRRLETLANTDGLTGVANRAFFEKLHSRAIQNAGRFKNVHFSIVIIDINGLKAINDSCGHDQGDAMINCVAGLLKTVCRETDTLSRIGGDEFAILLPATDSNQAARLVARIREKEAGLTIPCATDLTETARSPIRISIGLAGSDETRPDRVIKLADQRMYVDKAQFYQKQEAEFRC